MPGTPKIVGIEVSKDDVVKVYFSGIEPGEMERIKSYARSNGEMVYYRENKNGSPLWRTRDNLELPREISHRLESMISRIMIK